MLPVTTGLGRELVFHNKSLLNEERMKNRIWSLINSMLGSVSDASQIPLISS